MKTYHVRVITSDGTTKTGHLPAGNEKQLNDKLRAFGWRLIEIIPAVSSEPVVSVSPAVKGWIIAGSAAVLLLVCFAFSLPNPGSQIRASVANSAEQKRLDEYQAVTTRIEEWRAKGVNVSYNNPSVESADREAQEILSKRVSYQGGATSTLPSVAENGDVRGADNDGDGRREPVHVNGYTKADGTYVREHYRAAPSYTGGTGGGSTGSTGGTVQVRGYVRKDGTYVAPHTRSAPRR